jgi:hypothetical protein
MARFNHIQNNFLSGEISERLTARTETQEYLNGLKELKNCIVHTQGGATRRGGTRFIKDKVTQDRLTDATSLFGGTPTGYDGYVRLFEFIVSKDEAYIFIIKAAGADTSISILNVNSEATGTYTVSAGLAALQLSGNSVFDGYDTDDQLREVQFSQVGDVMFFVHPDKEPFVISRTAVDTFVRDHLTTFDSLGRDDPFVGYPYLPVNIDSAHTMTISGGLGTTLTSSKPIFTTGHIGSVFKHTTGGNTTSFRVAAFISSTIVTGSSGNATAVSGPRAASADWEESAWSTERGYPRTVANFQQRVFYGGTQFRPDTVHASEIGDLFELDARRFSQDPLFGSVVASDPFSFAPSSNVISQIQWMDSTSQSLNVGTLGREYIIRGSSGALSALDIFISPETSFGSFFRQPVLVDNALIFIESTRKKMRQFLFSRDENSFRSEDLTWLSFNILRRSAIDHNIGIINTAFESIKFQKGTNNVIWAIDKDQGLFSFTEDRAHGVRAAAYHRIGGIGGVGPVVAPRIGSIAVAPSSAQNIDELWMTVQRRIDSTDVTYIEKIGKEYEDVDLELVSLDINDKAVFSDSAVQVITAPGDTATGLDHLEGETVQVLGDGAFQGEAVVSGGSITIADASITAWIVGLKYESKINTLPIEAGSVVGSPQGSIKRIDRSVIRFLRTVGALFGSDPDNLERIVFRPPDLAEDKATPLFTGDKVLEFSQDYNRVGEVIIVQDLPLPFTVLGIISRGITYD